MIMPSTSSLKKYKKASNDIPLFDQGSFIIYPFLIYSNILIIERSYIL